MSAPVRKLLLTDEMIDVIVDRLDRFPDDDTDAHTVGAEVDRQQRHDPNHQDEIHININPKSKPIAIELPEARENRDTVFIIKKTGDTQNPVVVTSKNHYGK